MHLQGDNEFNSTQLNSASCVVSIVIIVVDRATTNFHHNISGHQTVMADQICFFRTFYEYNMTWIFVKC